MRIPNTRTYLDPITGKEEVWLEKNDQKFEKKWLRCLVVADNIENENLVLIPVSVQECVQNTTSGIVAKIRNLFTSPDPENCLYIPTEKGALGNETAQSKGQLQKNMYLAYGTNTPANITDLKHVDTYQGIHLMEGIVKPENNDPEVNNISNFQPIFGLVNNSEATDLHLGELNSLPPKERIEVIEYGLEKFEQLLLSKIETLGIQRPNLPLAIQNPFVFVRENKKNTLKYYGDAVIEAEKNSLPTAAVLFSLKEPFYFSYAFKEDINNNDGVIAFAPLLRSVIMNAYNSPENTFDNLVFMHEMVHCMHGATQRKRDIEKQLIFAAKCNGSSKKVVIQEEFDAYAVEIEALNLCLDNEMFLAAQNGKTLNPEMVMSKLKIESTKKMPITMLCKLGSIYLKNSSIGNYSAEYLELVSDMTMFDGYDLYTPDYQLISYGRK